MSDYTVGGLIQADPHMRRRVACCAMQEASNAVIDIGDPEVWAEAHSWEYAVTPGWVPAWASALESGVLEIGNDPAVITDAMILSSIQPMVVGG